jgi:hypothetical protein
MGATTFKKIDRQRYKKLEQIIIFECQKALYDHFFTEILLKKKTVKCKFTILKMVNQITN